jgi:hypothetical protein
MKTSFLFTLLALLLLPVISMSQVRVYNTIKITGKPPVIDGIIGEDAWNMAEWQGDFVQKEPYEYAAPSQQTIFKILYDDNNLYVAIRAFDTEPDKIERRMGRRDNLEGDWVAIGISSHFDHFTGYGFAVNAAGVKGDGTLSNDSDWDDTWDPVYYVKTSIDEKGWVAEFKIPFNQLRFGKKEQYTWGLEVIRQLFRKEEMSVWQMVPQEASGWVSLWGELKGIEHIKPKKEIALTPYLMGGIELSPKEEGNPFETGTNWLYNGGLDGKIAITNDLTLNFTINPDFGQVEADPSEVNLSAFESYFKEKRPFFVEGANIFNYPLVAGHSWSRENLFYSRRIGRRPQGYANLQTGEYASTPEFTRILGAFKLSGKTQNGWSIGVLESITNNEYTNIDSAGYRSKQIIEPMTNYFNTRIQKDIVKGKTIVGGMVTATNRFIHDSTLQFLPDAAYTAGLDFDQYWNDKTYNLKVSFIGSSVTGSEKSILERQTAPQRYYQRPDATHLHVDSTLTQLSGYGGSFMLGKIGRGHWRYGLRGNFTSPGLSLNDMGYMRRGDALNQSGWIEYVIWEPFGIFRKMKMRFNQWVGWDFKGSLLYSGMRARWETQFKNYWSVDAGVSKEFFDIDRHQLRGGPSVRTPGMFHARINLKTDQRKKLVAGVFVSRGLGSDNYRNSFDVGFDLSYRPLSTLQFSIDPIYVHDRESMIYIDTDEYNGKPVYLVSGLDRKSLQLNFRINYSITPDLTIQYWGQPFFFSGDYDEFKKVVDAGNKNYYDQFHVFTEDEITYDEYTDSYLIDESGNGQPDYGFGNPDFSFYEFRSNFVIRWEYIPGSTAYFVWSQGRNGSNGEGEFYLSDRISNLMDAAPSNIFLLKISYRLSF